MSIEENFQFVETTLYEPSEESSEDPKSPVDTTNKELIEYFQS